MTLARVKRSRMAGFDVSDPPHATAIESTLAGARLLLAVVSLLASRIDGTHPEQLADTVLHLLVGFMVYSAGVFVLARIRPTAVARHAVLLLACDLAWSSVLAMLTGGATGSFSAFFIYALIATSYRWGLVPTLATATVASVVLIAEALVSNALYPKDDPNLNFVLMRLLYLWLGGVLIGLLAEEERRQRLRSLAVTRIMSRVRAESGFVPSVRAILDDLVSSYSASHAILAVEEDGGQTFFWTVSRPDPEVAHRLRLRRGASRAGMLTGLNPAVEVAKLWLQTGTAQIHRVVALDVHGVPIDAGDAVRADGLCSLDFAWRSVLCLPHVSGDGWSGTLFVFDPRVMESSRAQLRFLQGVVRQVGPALFNLYLQRRLQSRSGVADRARLSRELHDGMIQSLIGLEMEMEVLRREVAGSVPAAVERRLTELQQALVQEVLNSRDLMQTLRPIEVNAGNFVEYVAHLVERFRYQTGIRARFSSDGDDLRLSTGICRELAAIVQEALINARKHSRASTVHVAVSGRAGGCRLAIEDDGRGFPFQGRFTLEDLEAARRGPAIIKERAVSIGASLVLDSEAGRGSRIIIDVANGVGAVPGVRREIIA